MQKHLNKKGFTIVELVIVIVVIAILAAVLIPTFIGLNRKAQIAADTSLARELNNAIAMSETDVDTFEEALAALRDGGFLIANLNAKAKGCYFVWEDKTNQIIYVDAENDFEVIYSNGTYEAIGGTWYLAVSNKAKADELKALNSAINVKMTIANTKDLSTAINESGTNTVYIDESLVIDNKSVIVMNNSEAKVTIDLGNATISGNNDEVLAVENVPFQLDAGELTLKGGVIAATGSYLDADGDPVSSAVVANAGILNLNGTVVDAPNGNIVISYEGANGTVSNSTIRAMGQGIGVFGGSEVVVENCSVDTGWEAVFVSDSGGVSKATIKGGSYNCDGNTVVSHGGIVVIEGGNFTATQENLLKMYSAGGSITIKGGTFSNATYKNYTLDMLTVDVIKAMIATGSTNYANITVTENADGSFTITN